MDIVKFAKLMGLTASSHDGEALNAIRLANAMLDEQNLTWGQFISQKTIVINEVVNNGHHQPYEQAPTQPSTDIRHMLDACLIHVQGSGRGFIKSLDDWYRRNGRLTEKQHEALKRWYDNL